MVGGEREKKNSSLVTAFASQAAATPEKDLSSVTSTTRAEHSRIIIPQK